MDEMQNKHKTKSEDNLSLNNETDNISHNIGAQTLAYIQCYVVFEFRKLFL